MNAFSDYDDLHGTPKKMAEARSYTPSWYERLAGAAANAFDGGSRGSYETAMKFVGPENPFNAPAQITRGGANMAEGYRRGDGLQAVGGAAEAGFAALPFASRSIGAALRQPFIKHGRESFDIDFPMKNNPDGGHIYGEINGRSAFVNGAYGYGGDGVNEAGTREILAAARKLQEQYPYVSDVYALRVSGARHAAGDKVSHGNKVGSAVDWFDTPKGQRIGDRIGQLPEPAQEAINKAIMLGLGAGADRPYNMHLRVKPGWQR